MTKRKPTKSTDRNLTLLALAKVTGGGVIDSWPSVREVSLVDAFPQSKK